MLGATVKQEHWPVHPGSNERKTCAPYYQTRYIEQRICIWMNVIKVIAKWEKKEKSLLINVAILCHLRYKRIVRQSNKTGLCTQSCKNFKKESPRDVTPQQGVENI